MGARKVVDVSRRQVLTYRVGVHGVRVDGRRAWIPEERVDALRAASPAIEAEAERVAAVRGARDVRVRFRAETPGA